MSERLERHHGSSSLACVASVPRRASGVTLLSSADVGRARAALAAGDCPIAELVAIVAVDGFRLEASGWLTRAGRATFEYRLLEREGPRALLEVRLGAPGDAHAVTGLLEALAAQAQPAVGDYERRGAPATRLLLHVSEARGRVSLRAPLPAAFMSWLRARPLQSPSEFRTLLPDAALLRWGMERSGEVMRLLDEGGGEAAGLGVERYGDYAVLSLSTPEAIALEHELAAYLLSAGARGVYSKQRLRADLRRRAPGELAPPLPVCGEAVPSEHSVQHAGLRFGVQLSEGLSTGLFLDQRLSWSRVRREAAGRSLLNLFCYTGAFTVAAAAGGARESLSVDLSGRALQRGQHNLALNGLAGSQHAWLQADVLAWLPRALEQKRRFDWIVLDPPSFGTRAKGVLDLARDYPALVRAGLGLLAPRGRLLCVAHQRRLSLSALMGLLQKAARSAGRAVKLRPLVGPWDCPTLPGVSGTKSVLVSCLTGNDRS